MDPKLFGSQYGNILDDADRTSCPKPVEIDIKCWNCRDGALGRISPASAVYCTSCGALQPTVEIKPDQ